MAAQSMLAVELILNLFFELKFLQNKNFNAFFKWNQKWKPNLDLLKDFQN
jgi:hypothetical protein